MGTNIHIDQWKQAESLLTAERRTLEMIAGGACLTDVLENLCREIDAQSPDVMSSVMLMDPDGKRLWPTPGPRVPKDWISGITPLPIGPRMGSCGTAAFRKQQVINPDIAIDPLWSGSAAEGYREIALRNGLRAAWSQPIISKSEELLGTFAMYYAEPKSPSASDLQLIEGAGHIALIATETERSRGLLKNAFEELKKSKNQLETILNTIPTVAWRGEPDGSINYFNQRWHDYTGLLAEDAKAWGWTATIHPDDLPRLLDVWEKLRVAKSAAWACLLSLVILKLLLNRTRSSGALASQDARIGHYLPLTLMPASLRICLMTMSIAAMTFLSGFALQ